jgi:orotate phosphoribosyltransferase
MNARDQLVQQIKDKAVVHGKVTLSSGQEADYYIDLRRITLDAAAAPLVGQVMLDATADLDYDAVGGLTLGADPVASAMLHAAAARGRALDAFVVRKAQKTHGMQRRIEGPDIAGRRVLVVEDEPAKGRFGPRDARIDARADLTLHFLDFAGAHHDAGGNAAREPVREAGVEEQLPVAVELGEIGRAAPTDEQVAARQRLHVTLVGRERLVRVGVLP